MKRKISILIALVNIILLSACSLRGSRFIIFDDSDKKAEARMEDILDALKDGDKDALKAMFSKKALSDAKNIEGQLDYLFDFFQGPVESWENTGFGSNGDIEHGEKSTMLRSYFTVTTAKDIYRFFLIDYSIDTINPDNEGLYTLRVISEWDEPTQFTNWQDMKIAGIYKPNDIVRKPTPSTEAQVPTSTEIRTATHDILQASDAAKIAADLDDTGAPYFITYDYDAAYFLVSSYKSKKATGKYYGGGALYLVNISSGEVLINADVDFDKVDFSKYLTVYNKISEKIIE